MKLYWPCAVYLKENCLERAFTYDSTLSLGDARNQIELWKDWYKFDIRKAWVDVYEDNIKIETIHINPKDGSILSTESDCKEENRENSVLHFHR